MKTTSKSRRAFIKQTFQGTALLGFVGGTTAFSPKSYRNIIGANEKVRVGVMGVNSRGLALAKNFSSQPNCEIISISDVDSRATKKCIEEVAAIQKVAPRDAPDFRRALENKDLDAMVIAAPDHWHAPATILASKAGKHVYVEKPASHNPREGEIMVEVQKKYKNIVQLGTQRRSWPNIIKMIEELRNGTIGRPYFAKGWYTNNRESIGIGKEISVPAWLDYELWQGPAPRTPLRDNLIHYNWHWFWKWGTGEALNNGTHTVDMMRWGLGVDYPTKVTSAGGRYRYKDDWETPDTQVISLEFPNNTGMTWEGRSCNGRSVEGSSVGVTFFGDKGSIQNNGGNDYKIFDLDNKLVKEIKDDNGTNARNKMDPSQNLDARHIQNFFAAIKNGDRLNADIETGQKSTFLCQLGNIAQRSGSELLIDPSNGHIKDNPKADQLWTREYEKGWEPTA